MLCMSEMLKMSKIDQIHLCNAMYVGDVKDR